jgi:hypothetical protein
MGRASQQELEKDLTVFADLLRIGFHHQSLLDLLDAGDPDATSKGAADLHDAETTCAFGFQGFMVTKGRCC